MMKNKLKDLWKDQLNKIDTGEDWLKERRKNDWSKTK